MVARIVPSIQHPAFGMSLVNVNRLFVPRVAIYQLWEAELSLQRNCFMEQSKSTITEAATLLSF